MFATRHEHDLSEIKSLTHELDQSARHLLDQLARFNESLHELLTDGGDADQRNASAGASHDADAPTADPYPLLAFVHIPKTAGGTVISMFAAAYSRGGIRDTGNYFRNPEGTPSKVTRRAKSGGRVLAGHTPYGILQELLPADTRYMTFLREPVDRVFSQYWRHIRRKDPRNAGRVKKRPGARTKPESLEEAFVEMRLPEINNLATRFLCGRRSALGELPASALDDAKENLSKFEFIGIQERFDESLVLLQRMLGLGSVPYEDRHVSSDRPTVDDIPDAHRALIEEHNQLDTELYEFGLGLFEDAVTAAADEAFAADVRLLRASSTEANEDTIRNAHAWLARELPVGATRHTAELRREAKAAGLTVPALTHALADSSVKREPLDGQRAFTRVSEPQ